MASEFVLALSTFPDSPTAARICERLVEEKFVACANLLPAIESIYRWQGKIERTSETLVFFKMTAASYADFQARLRALHPYEVPEIICLGLTSGLPEYLRWLSDSSGG